MTLRAAAGTPPSRRAFGDGRTLLHNLAMDTIEQGTAREHARPAAWRRRLAIVVALLAAATASCRSSLTAPTESVPFSHGDVRVGSGGTAASGDTLAVTYTGGFYDPSQPEDKGAQFDTSGGELFTFVLGSTQVIDGWNRGLEGMQVGGTRRLIVPPSLAYGAARHGVIPPNATLLFDVTLAANITHQ
jgi:FKBP-type peptidyl-prolyl cis-trans isomerase FkpA